jgi:hypothetical protein
VGYMKRERGKDAKEIKEKNKESEGYDKLRKE